MLPRIQPLRAPQALWSTVMLAFVSALAVWPGTLWAAEADKATPTYRLAAAGNDQILWLIVGEYDSEKKTWRNWLAYREKTQDRIWPVSSIGPQVPRIDRWAVVGEALHVFFENGTHYQYSNYKHPSYPYSRTRGRRERPLLALPEAIAGEFVGERPKLWAVVTAEIAEDVQADWEKVVQRREAQSEARRRVGKTKQPLPKKRVKHIPIQRDVFHLVRYESGDWRPGFAAPKGCTPGSRVWLCLSVRQHHLFWQLEQDDSRIHYARFEKGSWETAQPIVLAQPVYKGFAAVINHQVIFSALVRGANDDDRLRCDRWVWLAKENQAGQWSALPPLETHREDETQGQDQPEQAGGQVQHFSRDAAPAALGDLLAVMVRGQRESEEVAFWRASEGGPPMMPFLAVPMTRDQADETKDTRSREFIGLAIVGAIVLLVFWVRQESISSPVALPMSLSVVGPGKRALAALVDLIPAMAVVVVVWYDPLVPYLQEFAAVSATGDKEALEDFVSGSRYPNLLWAGVTFRLTYTLYCTVFELLILATPGKRLLGCMILSESLDRPNRIQILTRNLTRMVELEPLLKIWPFVLVIFFTRNRQRIGDLLARTIVVERQSVIDSNLPSDSNGADNDTEA